MSDCQLMKKTVLREVNQSKFLRDAGQMECAKLSHVLSNELYLSKTFHSSFANK